MHNIAEFVLCFPFAVSVCAKKLIWLQLQQYFVFSVNIAFFYVLKTFMLASASCSNGNAFVFGARDLMFKFRPGQIELKVANGSPPLQHSSKRAVLPGRNDK